MIPFRFCCLKAEPLLDFDEALLVLLLLDELYRRFHDENSLSLLLSHLLKPLALSKLQLLCQGCKKSALLSAIIMQNPFFISKNKVGKKESII